MSNRTIWIIAWVLTLWLVVEAVLVPGKRDMLLEGGIPVPLVLAGFWIDLFRGRRLRRERRAQAAVASAELAVKYRDNMPVDVVALVAAGQKIQAIKRFRELSGAGLKDAKDLIDAL